MNTATRTSYTVGSIAVHVDAQTYAALPSTLAGHEGVTALAAATVNAAAAAGVQRRERREHAALMAVCTLAGAAGLVGLVAAVLAVYSAASAIAASAAVPGGIGITLAVRRTARKGA